MIDIEKIENIDDKKHLCQYLTRVMMLYYANLQEKEKAI